MKRFYFSILSLFLLCLCSCKFDADDSKGSLVVRNSSGDADVYISAVYAKDEDASGWQLVWSGKISSGSSEFIELDEGSYSVRIITENSLFEPFLSAQSYETGYNVYKTLKEDDFLNVEFDGSGIYFA